MSRFAFFVLILSAILFGYPAWRLGSWLGFSGPLLVFITLIFFLSQFLVRFVLRHNKTKTAYVIRHTADLVLGVSPYVLGAVLVGEIVLLTTEVAPKTVALGVLGLGVLVGAIGLVRAWRPAVVKQVLSSSKLKRPVRFVQISDVHIGSRTGRFLRQIIDSVNTLDAEFLVITGDFIDRRDVGVDRLASLKSFPGPIYFSTGNHEHYEDLEDIVTRLEQLGVVVLRNRSIKKDDIQIVGIDDSPDPRQVAKILPEISVSTDHYSILLYHRPRGLEDAHAHGIDLKLSGHTHNGQIVPFNFVVSRVFKYTRGLYRYQDTYLYVNEGTGTWGPALRIGTRSEVTLFELVPES